MKNPPTATPFWCRWNWHSYQRHAQLVQGCTVTEIHNHDNGTTQTSERRFEPYVRTVLVCQRCQHIKVLSIKHCAA